MNNKTIVFASDHAGFKLKEALIKWAKQKNFKIEDLGPNNDQLSTNYATQGLKLAKNVVKSNNKIGIGICGTGIGISLAVNRVKGIRGARLVTKQDAKFAKQHNNANILLLGGKQISISYAKKMITKFLETKYEAGRHEQRIKALDK